MGKGRQTLPHQVRYGKWAGLYAGVAAMIAYQQISATWIYAKCPQRTFAFVLGLGIACALVSLAAGAWSWTVRQSLRADADAHATTKTDRFIASLSAAIAGTGVLYVVFAAAAEWFLQCQR